MISFSIVCLARHACGQLAERTVDSQFLRDAQHQCYVHGPQLGRGRDVALVIAVGHATGATRRAHPAALAAGGDQQVLTAGVAVLAGGGAGLDRALEVGAQLALDVGRDRTPVRIAFALDGEPGREAVGSTDASGR